MFLLFGDSEAAALGVAYFVSRITGEGLKR